MKKKRKERLLCFGLVYYISVLCSSNSSPAWHVVHGGEARPWPLPSAHWQAGNGICHFIYASPGGSPGKAPGHYASPLKSWRPLLPHRCPPGFYARLRPVCPALRVLELGRGAYATADWMDKRAASRTRVACPIDPAHRVRHSSSLRSAVPE